MIQVKQLLTLSGSQHLVPTPKWYWLETVPFTHLPGPTCLGAQACGPQSKAHTRLGMAVGRTQSSLRTPHGQGLAHYLPSLPAPHYLFNNFFFFFNKCVLMSYHVPGTGGFGIGGATSPEPSIRLQGEWAPPTLPHPEP